MLVALTPHRFGYVTVRPVNARQEARIVAAMMCDPETRETYRTDGGYCASIEEAASLFDLSPGHVRDLEAGWPLRIRADDWLVAMTYGYDAADNLA